ncbi:hypothetical protein ANO11243_052330 [Dothideomycetidae sp. 11243]|nr:hypothetical protein ANO11243_052330 [fungal sp. No.11243]
MSGSLRSRSTTGALSIVLSYFFLLGSLCISPVTAQETPPPVKSAADYYVDHLPGAPLPLLRMHAGHIEVAPEHHGNLFFWQFENRHIGKTQRTVLWLNGGPGCSSLDGAMLELGPYRVEGDNLRLLNGSWDEYANLVFVDQPVGTGFSYVDTNSYLHELDQVADHMKIFLEKYFAIFPEHSADDLYIAGESYAGQYIPYIAKAILDRNKKAGKPWNLKGIMIGNGWIAPNEQYLAYLPYAYKENMIQANTPEAETVEKTVAACNEALSKNPKEQINTRACERILNDVLRVTHEMSSMNGQCYNMYDIRKTDVYNSCGMNWPGELPITQKYLKRKEVASALHINPDKVTGWRECNDEVNRQLSAANSPPSVELLPDILAEIPVLLFSGDRDFICNHLGTEAFINKLSFNGGNGFETSPGVTAPKLDWTFDGEPAGIYQSARNLTYVLVYNSSHMVPYDYPDRSRDMLDRFIGVDYSSVAGSVPEDSAIDGLPGAKNETRAQQQRLDQARWDAYYRSGEVALVVVLIAAGLWAWFLIRSRRANGYKGLFGGDDDDNNRGLSNGILHRKGRDVEAADFDEAELDDLAGSRQKGRYEDRDEDRFDVGDDYDSDDVGEEHVKNKANGLSK